MLASVQKFLLRRDQHRCNWRIGFLKMLCQKPLTLNEITKCYDRIYTYIWHIPQKNWAKSQEDRQRTYNVTLYRVRVIVVATVTQHCGIRVRRVKCHLSHEYNECCKKKILRQVCNGRQKNLLSSLCKAHHIFLRFKPNLNFLGTLS